MSHVIATAGVDRFVRGVSLCAYLSYFMYSSVVGRIFYVKARTTLVDIFVRERC